MLLFKTVKKIRLVGLADHSSAIYFDRSFVSIYTLYFHNIFDYSFADIYNKIPMQIIPYYIYYLKQIPIMITSDQVIKIGVCPSAKTTKYLCLCAI